MLFFFMRTVKQMHQFRYRSAISAPKADLCAAVAACEMRNEKINLGLHKAVCRINAYTESIDVLEPYKDRDSGKGVGTGFVILVEGKPYIATAFHVVDESVRLQIVFEHYFSGRPLNGYCIGGNPELDVAILVLDDDEVDMSELATIPVGDSDKLSPLDEVSALGFALGQRHLQTSKGVVSGRKAIPNRVQADVAVNPGNSGGPVLTTGAGEAGQCIGIVTSGHSHAQGLNYLAPMNEAMQVFVSVVKARPSRTNPFYTSGVSFNAHFAQMNDVLIRSIGCDSGVFITATNYARDEPDQLKAGDVLCRIEIPEQKLSFSIDMQMRITAPWSRNKIEFFSILDRLRIKRTPLGDESEPVVFHVLRGADIEQPRALKTTLGKSRSVLRDVYPYVESQRFVSRAGVVVQMLNENIQTKSSWIKRCRYADFPTMDFKSVLIITHLAPGSPFAHDDAIGQYDYPEAINNHAIQYTGDKDPLQVFAEAFDTEYKNSSIITLRMRDGTMASASKSQIQEYEQAAQPKTVSLDGAVSVCTFDDDCTNVRGSR
jgi:S1-C subfamily serine protease